MILHKLHKQKNHLNNIIQSDMENLKEMKKDMIFGMVNLQIQKLKKILITALH